MAVRYIWKKHIIFSCGIKNEWLLLGSDHVTTLSNKLITSKVNGSINYSDEKLHPKQCVEWP